MYLIDTNIVSETRRVRPHAGVMAFLREAGDRNLYISAVTLGEIQTGIEITREQDPAKAAEIEAWADQIAAVWNILPMDAATFRVWAKLVHRRSDTLSEDAMIAATAIIHGMRVVTRNVADFKALGVEILNPYPAR
ncbi:MAG: type II toxin-antitoxin system VapC family toxin [Xanthobacteraceae bacterium]|nr:type II toxin-antitoxin system VapC family toxin [Xanthobacteraceae bacterium]